MEGKEVRFGEAGSRTLRGRDDRDLDRCGQLDARLADRRRRRGHALQHACSARSRPAGSAPGSTGCCAGRRDGLPVRPDGRPDAGVPRQEDRPARDRAGRRSTCSPRRPSSWSAPPSRSATDAGLAGLQEPGPHGLSEAMYAVTSAGQQQRLGVRRPHVGHAVLEHAARASACWPAGSCRSCSCSPSPGGSPPSSRLPAGAGTLPTHRPLFVGLLTGVALVVVGLTFVPVLALGPIVEALS